MGKNIFDNLKRMDTSYLLDPSAVQEIENTKVTDESVKSIDINLMIPFKNHPFEINTETPKFQELVASIEEYGILQPIVARKCGDRYEIISGHCRVEAARILNMETVPVNVVELSDVEATVIMVHSNVYAREKISLSEKARAYRMCMDKEKEAGRKVKDFASVVGAGKDSRMQVYRYIRLSYLNDELLKYMDRGNITIDAGVELSYLDEESQNALCGFITEVGLFPSVAHAKELRSAAENESLSGENIISMLVSNPKPKTVNKLVFKTNDIRDYFHENTSAEEMSDIIRRLLEKYKAGEINLDNNA
jgi:ParB family chromosome partitioning protein